METVGQEGHKDVRLNPVLQLVENRTQTQVVLEVLEGRLDLRELKVKLPELARGMGRAVKEFSAARDEIEKGLTQSGSTSVAPSLKTEPSHADGSQVS